MQRPKGTILFVEDSETLRQIVSVGLTERGYKVVTVPTGEEAFPAMRLVTPDLVLLDINLPDIDGYEVCKRIKSDPLSHHVPIMVVTSLEETGFEIMAIEAGADDFVNKPIDPMVLDARITMILRRIRRERFANPLTGLPGDVIIEQRVASLFEAGKPFALCHVDIDNFHTFNRLYGYARGDDLLAWTAGLVSDVTGYGGKVGITGDEPGGEAVLVGHVGGDDFVYVCGADVAKPLAERLVERFDTEVLEHYDEEDRKRGHVVIADRLGREQKHPLMSISVIIVSTDRRTYWSPLEMTDTATELKAYAKGIEGSVVVEDRREVDDGSQEDRDAEDG